MQGPRHSGPGRLKLRPGLSSFLQPATVALAKITKLPSVSTEFVEEVQLLKEKVTIKGHYLKASNARVYLRLTVSGLPHMEGTTLQVCDIVDPHTSQVSHAFHKRGDYLEAEITSKLSLRRILLRITTPTSPLGGLPSSRSHNDSQGSWLDLW